MEIRKFTQDSLNEIEAQFKQFLYTDEQQMKTFIPYLQKLVMLNKIGKYDDSDQQFSQYINLQCVLNGNTVDFSQEKIAVIFASKEKNIKFQYAKDYRYIIVFTEQLKGQKMNTFNKLLTEKQKTILFFLHKTDLLQDIFHKECIHKIDRLYKINKADLQKKYNLQSDGFNGIDKNDFFAQIMKLKQNELLVIEYVSNDGIMQQIRGLQ